MSIGLRKSNKFIVKGIVRENRIVFLYFIEVKLV